MILTVYGQLSGLGCMPRCGHVYNHHVLVLHFWLTLSYIIRFLFLVLGNTYSNAVQGALAATQNILGDLGLDEEVEVKMYDSDSLPSPPPSSDSEEENDPLLDFTREDAFSYTPGKPVKKDTQSLAESVRQATQALEVS